MEDTASGSAYAFDGQKIYLRPATDDERLNNAIPKYKFVDNFGPGNYVNDAIGFLFEPGSIFKAITVATGIDTGDIKPSDMYDDK